MTSIRHYNNPHIIKLDARYKGFVSGFKYRIDFDISWSQTGENWDRWVRVITWCENSFGKENFWTRDNQYRNTHGYRTSIPKNKSFRQLFLRSEEDLTMMLLVMGK